MTVQQRLDQPSTTDPDDAPRDLVVFSGQGAQTPHMGKGLYRALPAFREVYDEAADVLGHDLVLVGEGSGDSFRRPEVVQPLLVAFGVAAWAALRAETGVRPVAFAGHSLGEVAALVAAGSLDLRTALRFARERGRAMGACPPGAMAVVIGPSADVVETACRQVASGVVGVANVNLPDQTVVSGEQSALDAACAALRADGAIVKPLRITVAAHSDLMAAAERTLADVVGGLTVADPATPVLSTLTGEPLVDAEAVRTNLHAAMTRRVDWVGVMAAAAPYDITRVLECGPRTVLRDLAVALRPEATSLAVTDAAGLDLLGLRHSAADVPGSARRALRLLAGTPRRVHTPERHQAARAAYARLQEIVDAPDGVDPAVVQDLLVEGMVAKGFDEAATSELAAMGGW